MPKRKDTGPKNRENFNMLLAVGEKDLASLRTPVIEKTMGMSTPIRAVNKYLISYNPVM